MFHHQRKLHAMLEPDDFLHILAHVIHKQVKSLYPLTLSHHICFNLNFDPLSLIVLHQ
jgi:hypothetical protein